MKEKMKVFAFTLEGSDDWVDWVVAANKESALECLKEFSDMADIDEEAVLECNELDDTQLDTLKFYLDENGTGEAEGPSQTFREAILGRESEMPFHLCSQID